MTENNLPPLIQQMQQAEFYPHSVTTPITLVQTHVSYVLLTGEYAYKLKKPVNFGFLDFSTLDKRQQFVGEEIRLNKPVAPDIYVEILPITQKDDNYLLGGEGEAVEYALKMRQFPQKNLLIEMFKQGTLTEQHLEELGKLVAQFHSQTETNDYISSFGEVEQIAEAITDNYDSTSKYIGMAQTKTQYTETKEYTDKFLAEKKELFRQRREKDKIRECHGDLHLQNICVWNDKIQLFDRIEFNEPFRFVDVMYDVAFAVMDLDAKDRQDLGNIFLNTYVEQTGDWEGLQVLPLYLSRQAYVRAKVTSFLLDDPGIPAEDKEQAKTIAAGYYRLAWEYTKKKQGRLILMSGLSGSGKTTVAKQLAIKTGAIVIRSDAVRKHLVGIPLDEKGTNELYTPAMNEKTYQGLLDLGILLAKDGWTVILDAKYDRLNERNKALTLAKSENIPYHIIQCQAPTPVLEERLSGRTGDISDATPDLLKQQLAGFEDFTPDEQAYLTTVETTSSDFFSELERFLSILPEKG